LGREAAFESARFRVPIRTLPEELIGCPFATKTLDAAEGGRSVFLVGGFGVNLGIKEVSDCEVLGRFLFVRRRDGLRAIVLIVLEVPSFNGIVGPGGKSNINPPSSGKG